MLKNCGGGPRPIRLCVEKKKNRLGGPRPIRLCVERLKILMNFNNAGPVGKNGPKF